MPIDIQDQIANLRIKISEQEREIALLERECEDLRNDLSDFEERYNQIIKPLSAQIDAVKSALDALRDLHLKQQMGDLLSVESLWNKQKQTSEHYVPPHERDFKIPEPVDRPIHQPKTLKQLYRQLARQYHPDLAQNEDDRERRNRLMSIINHAYQEGDLDSLQALDESITLQAAEIIDSQIPLDMMILRGLQQQFHKLAVHLRDLKEERHNLRYGHMMELKLEESMAKARGEDLLAELADELQTEYWRYVRELDALRQQVK